MAGDYGAEIFWVVVRDELENHQTHNSQTPCLWGFDAHAHSPNQKLGISL